LSHLRADIVNAALTWFALYPQARSAMLPLLHLAQEQDGYLSDGGIAEVAELTNTTPADVRGTASFYDMFSLGAGGQIRRLDLHQHWPASWRAAKRCSNRSAPLWDAPWAGRPTMDSSRSKRPNAWPTVTTHRACRSTTATCVPPTIETFNALVNQLRDGQLDHDVPTHGTLVRVRRSVGLSSAASRGH